MTPKEKAEELMVIFGTKQLALAAVNEVIVSGPLATTVAHYREILNEITKLR